MKKNRLVIALATSATLVLLSIVIFHYSVEEISTLSTKEELDSTVDKVISKGNIDSPSQKQLAVSKPPLKKSFVEIDSRYIEKSFKAESIKFTDGGRYSIATKISAIPSNEYSKDLGKRVLEKGTITYFQKEISETDLFEKRDKTYPVVINRQNNGLGILTGGISVVLTKSGEIEEITNNYPLRPIYHLEGTETYYLMCNNCNIKEVVSSLSNEDFMVEVTPEIIQYHDSPR